MAYNKAKLEKQALDAIAKHDLVFYDEVISYLPCSSATFYNKKMEELESLKDALHANKIKLKQKLRRKMLNMDNATATIALYKLVGSEEETAKLNGSKQEIKHSGSIQSFNVLPPEKK